MAILLQTTTFYLNWLKMKEFHLFAGMGGGIYGSYLNNSSCVGAVEIDPFCQKVLSQRQKDGWMNEFPIFGDLTKLSGKKFKSKFDVLCGGFPCQAFSTAARGRNLAEKDLWLEMFRFIQESEAPIVFAENVTKKAIIQAKNSLESINYKVEYCMLSNGDLGADHQRSRVWMIAIKMGSETFALKHFKKLHNAKPIKGEFWSKDIEKLGKVTPPVERRKQLKALGNAQSPMVAGVAFRVLANRLKSRLSQQVTDKEFGWNVTQSELNAVYVSEKTWIQNQFGDNFGYVHTPTTMANYSAPSMMKHKGCRNFVEVFNTPEPENAEFLMGFPINASNLNKQTKSNFNKWIKCNIG